MYDKWIQVQRLYYTKILIKLLLLLLTLSFENSSYSDEEVSEFQFLKKQL